jgi:hypothetical protein
MLKSRHKQHESEYVRAYAKQYQTSLNKKSSYIKMNKKLYVANFQTGRRHHATVTLQKRIKL